MNEKHFNLGITTLVLCVIGYLLFSGSIEKNSLIGMFGAIGFNVALLLSIGFGSQYFQYGTKENIQDKIYIDGNIAASIYQAGIWISLAIVIAKGLF